MTTITSSVMAIPKYPPRMNAVNTSIHRVMMNHSRLATMPSIDSTADTVSTSGQTLVEVMRSWDAVIVFDARRRDALRLGGCVAGLMESPPFAL